jgi:hypothetical protein
MGFGRQSLQRWIDISNQGKSKNWIIGALNVK